MLPPGSRYQVRGTSYFSCRCDLPLDARVQFQLLDDLVQLPLRQIDLRRCPLRVQQARAHRDRDLVQVANLAEYVVGGAAEAGEAALLGEGAPIAEHELLLRQAPRE